MRRTILGLTTALVLGAGACPLAAQEPPPRFSADAQVVVLDVVATDRKGKPVEDLRRDELQVSEDGRPCEILSFRLVRARLATPPPAAVTAAPPAPAAAERAAGAPQGTATPTRPSLVVLVFDPLTTLTAPLARKGALDLVSREFPADTWFAVFKLGYADLRLLTPFTTDAGRLRSSIEEATAGEPEWRGTRASGLEPVLVGSEPEPEPTGPTIPGLREVAAAVGGEELALDRYVEGKRRLKTLLAVAQALAAVEGRKSVVYFAEAWHFPVSTRPMYDDAVSAANRANVAIHTVDARGLTAHKPLGLTPIDSVLSRFTADHGGGPGAGATTPPLEAGSIPGREPGLRAKSERRAEQLSGPQLEHLADDTGGLAIQGTNDLAAGLAGVAEELRQYYEVVYAPANPVADGRFRRIGAKVSRPGLRLRTRAGYFATPGRPTLAAYELPLMDALVAEPPARDFALHTGVLYFAPKEGERECVVLAEVPLSGVQVAADELGGAYRAHLTLLGYVRDEGGRVVARLSHDWPIEGPLREREAARARSAVFRRTLTLAAGRYALETAVQDRRRGGSSVTRRTFDVPPAGAGLSLGSIAVLQRAEPAPTGPATGDPLRVENVSLVPGLEAPFVIGSSPELPVFVAVYPAVAGGPVELAVELRRGPGVVAQASTPLPAAGADGRIPWIGGIPAARLLPGSYEIVVRATQDGAAVEERTRVEVENQKATLPPG